MAKKMNLIKKLTSTGVISTAGKTAIVKSITLASPSGLSVGSIIIKDGGTGGTEKWKLSLAPTGQVGDTSTSITFDGGANNLDGGIVCSTDAFGTIAGTGSIAYILFDEIEA